MSDQFSQRKIRRDVGRDSHVRHIEDDIHKTQSSQSFEIIKGEVLYPQPEPLFRQGGVTVQLAKGGMITGVAYPNAFIDPDTGNQHGLYEGMLPGQMVAVGFLNGNSSSPFVVNRFPYQGCSDARKELSYIQPMTKKQYDATDVIIGHFSGSAIRFNTGILSGKLPGSISVEAATRMEVSANTEFNVSSLVSMSLSSMETTIEGKTKLTVSGGQVQLSATGKLSLSGSTGTEVKSSAKLTLSGQTGTELLSSAGMIKIASKTQSMKDLIDGLFTVLEGLKTAGSPAAQTIDPATVALLEAEKAKWAALLE